MKDSFKKEDGSKNSVYAEYTTLAAELKHLSGDNADFDM